MFVRLINERNNSVNETIKPFIIAHIRQHIYVYFDYINNNNFMNCVIF